MSTVDRIEPLLRVTEVTALLGISRTTLWEWKSAARSPPLQSRQVGTVRLSRSTPTHRGIRRFRERYGVSQGLRSYGTTP